MIRYNCEGYIKISIHEDLALLEMKHLLHQTRADISIPLDVKQFILNNIDLLPHEIYKRLVEHDLNINIRQKQVHFWWTELGKGRYKRNEDSFISAKNWLEEKSYEIIFQNEAPKTLGFLTILWHTLQNSQFQICEIGVDATCK